MTKACKLAQQKAYPNAFKAKRHNDRRVRSSVLQLGDRVLMDNIMPRAGPGKLGAYWEDNVCVVVRRKDSNSPVYEVKPEVGDVRRRILHRNLLLPWNYLPADTSDTPRAITYDAPGESMARRVKGS